MSAVLETEEQRSSVVFVDSVDFVLKAMDEGQLEIIPHLYAKTWKNWLSNIKYAPDL